MKPPDPHSDPRGRLVAWGIFLAVALLAVVAGAWFYLAEVETLKREKAEDLALIGEFKSRQIHQFRTHLEVKALRVTRLLPSELIEQLLEGALDAEARRKLLERLHLSEPETEEIFLYTPEGVPVLGDDEEGHPVSAPPNPALLSAMEQAASSGRPAFADLYRSLAGETYLDVVSPLSNEDGETVAVLVLRSNVSESLYPLLASWPRQSKTAEAYMLQRQGSEVLFLSNLRHKSDTALKLRAPITETNQSAVKAVLGNRGVFEGSDYRGADVLSYLQPVPDSPWFLVAEIDKGELYDEVAYHASIVLLVVCLLILAVGSVTALVYRRRQASISRRLLGLERKRRQEQEIFQTLFRNMIDGFAVHELVCDSNGQPEDYRFIDVNPAFESILGMAAADVVGRSVTEILPGIEPKWIERYARVVDTGVGEQFEDYSAELGRHFKVSAFRLEPGKFATLVVDVTAEKESAAKIERLSQLYAALSGCNHAIVKSEDLQSLLETVCRVIVEEGGMRLAWIGMKEESPSSVRNAACYGEDTAYLEGIEISISADEPAGRGPVGTAIRENMAVWCDDFQTDPSTAHWHERAVDFGLRAAAALPLNSFGETVGALAIYSNKPEAFDPQIRELLLEMADDIGFAIENFTRQADLKRTNRELVNLRTAVEQSGNTIVITDAEGQIEYVNPAFETSTGYSAAEAVGLNPRILSSGEQPPSFYQQLWTTVTSGETWQGQFHNRRKDGTLYWESATISPVTDGTGQILHFIAVKEDITERKALEVSLVEALERAEQANRTKSEFLAVMSHELRTPLNGVIGFAELLAETPLNTEQATHAETIKTCGAHLLQIVNDILDFSSIERGRMLLAIGPVDVAELLAEATIASRRAAEEKGLIFRCTAAEDVPPSLQGDALRLRQILINLLGNAVKFTTKGSVSLHLASGLVDGAPSLVFSIEDTGPGISQETIERLFKPFTQGDSSLRRPFEGTGLGLAISQRLAEAMGGAIDVRSTVGKGTTFTFRLPLAIADSEGAAAKPDEPTPPVDLEGLQNFHHHVLVVEDDRISSMLAGKLLSSLGHTAEFAANGRQALDAFVPGKFSLVLMDMQMPFMDGIEATREIRKRESGARVPIIALTANVLPRDREQCLAAGMDDFLTKPFRKDLLAAKLAAFAGSK